MIHRLRLSCGIEAGDATTVRRHPVGAASRLKNIVDGNGGQSVIHVVVCKLRTVESRESIRSTEPEKAVRVSNYARDAIVWQTICGGVFSDRQSFGARQRRKGNQQRQQRKRNGACASVLLSENDSDSLAANEVDIEARTIEPSRTRTLNRGRQVPSTVCGHAHRPPVILVEQLHTCS